MIFTLNQSGLSWPAIFTTSAVRPEGFNSHVYDTAVARIKDTYALLNWYESARSLRVRCNHLAGRFVKENKGELRKERSFKRRGRREIKGLKQFIKRAYR